MTVSGRHSDRPIDYRSKRNGRPASVVALLILALALAGCAEFSEYPAFDRAPTAADKLPSSFDGVDTSQFGADDVRFGGHYENTDFYLLREGTGMCLGVSANGTAAYGCAGAGLEFTSQGVVAQLVDAPAIATPGWTTVGDNIRVQD